MPSGDGLYVVSSGHRHPSTVLETAAIEAVLPGLSPGWVEKRLGIESRRVALPHERVADLGVAALGDALGRAGWEAETVHLIVCGSSFIEELMPARASVIAEAVNPSAVAFDVNAACSSFLYALSVADAMLAGDPRFGRAAVCVVERPTMSADYRDSHSSVFFGDSAGAALIQRGDPGQGWQVEGIVLLNDAVGGEAVRVPRHGHFMHDNRAAFEHVLRMGQQVIGQLLETAGLEPAEVTAFVGHQANATVLGALGDALGVPWERQWHNFEWAGNQGAAGILTAFSGGWHERTGSLRPGDRVVLNSVGSGYTAAAALLRWVG